MGPFCGYSIFLILLYSSITAKSITNEERIVTISPFQLFIEGVPCTNMTSFEIEAVRKITQEHITKELNASFGFESETKLKAFRLFTVGIESATLVPPVVRSGVKSNFSLKYKGVVLVNSESIITSREISL